MHNRNIICLFFSGYLIGESIEPRDVQIADGHFENAYQMDYMFKPADIVTNFSDGHMEVYIPR